MSDTNESPEVENPTTHRQDLFREIVIARKSWKTQRSGEIVWPPELERLLLEGLQAYQPGDSRGTRILGRFPLRNRFISDYIFHKTGIRRTAKQVASRLKQLRDTFVKSRSSDHLNVNKLLKPYFRSLEPRIQPSDSAMSYPELSTPGLEQVILVESSLHSINQKVEILVATLERIFASHEEYRRLISCDKSSAQRLLDIFQRLLDILDSPRSRFQNDLLVATQRLAGKSGLYPMCFELKDVATVGEFCVSNGAFADIYKGILQDRAVCLKTIRLDQRTDIQHFLKVCSKEAVLWGQLSHPNLLPFYGIYRFRNRLSLVSPWMEHGDIRNYLQKYPSANRVLLASDVAQGLCFLHDNGIIHGDLKGPNILVNELGSACLADFGLSSISDPGILVWTSQSSAASKGGSVRWQAPELFDPDTDEDVHNTVFTDVYAWACVAYEIFAGQIPFSHLSRDTAVSLKVRNGERPARPEDSSISWTSWGLTENIWRLMEDGWKANPTDRPTVQGIIERLGSELRRWPSINEITEQKQNALSPAKFRQVARAGLDVEDMSVETIMMILNAP